MRRGIILAIILTLFIIPAAAAQKQKLDPKRVNPGIPGERVGMIIYDILNLDMMHKVEGFLFCDSEEATWDKYGDTYGRGGVADYPSPYFTMDYAPSQMAATLYFDADSAGDKKITCTLKYLPFKYNEDESARLYLRKDGTYTEERIDEEYLTIPSEDTIPFLTGIESPLCPEEKPLCTAQDIYDAQPSKAAYTAIPVFIVILVTSLVAIRKKRKS